MNLNLENKKELAYVIQIFGCILYVILIFVAIAFYTGGNPVNNNAPGYSFWQTSLSALGSSISYSGADNTISMIIFTIATSIFGFSFFPLFAALPSLFNDTKKQKNHSVIGSIFGIIGGITMIGIAFTPSNLFIVAHMIFVYIGYTSISVIGILYSIALNMNEKFSNTYTIAIVIFTIVWEICIIIMLIGLDSWTPVAQKIGRYTIVGALIILGYGALKLEKNSK